MQKLSFTDHRRQLLANRYVYAVVSRRAKGLSIGVNLNINQFCNFDCPYCQVDRTQPNHQGIDVDVEIVLSELEHLLQLITRGELWQIAPFDTVQPGFDVVRDISISGDGEPTVCPQFADVVAGIGRLIQQYELTEVDFNVFSNATLFHKKKVQDGLMKLWQNGGRIWAKLDAGTQEWFERVNQSQVTLDVVLRNILWAGQQGEIVIQAMFHSFGDEKPSPLEIQTWQAHLQSLLQQGAQISWIQIYTTARKPAQEDVQPLSAAFLQNIGAQTRIALKAFPNLRITVSS